jgi:hypothetical protein
MIDEISKFATRIYDDVGVWPFLGLAAYATTLWAAAKVVIHLVVRSDRERAAHIAEVEALRKEHAERIEACKASCKAQVDAAQAKADAALANFLGLDTAKREDHRLQYAQIGAMTTTMRDGFQKTADVMADLRVTVASNQRHK